MALRRGRRVAVVAALAGVSVIALSGVALREQVVEWWYRHERIPVVRTWQDLLRTEPIDLGDGTTARVGMEARRCPAGTGVLLYCVTEGWEPSGGNSWTLGPFGIRKDGEWIVPPIEENARIGRSLRHGVPSGAVPFWFAAALPVDRPGTVRVQLETRDGKPLRGGVVEGTREPVHDWLPFGKSTRPRELRRLRPGEKPVPVAHVSNTRAERALPRWEPFFVQVGDPPRGDPPRLLPDAPDSGFQLEAEEGGLLITADEAFAWRPTRASFLARWWINGEPVPAGKWKEFTQQERIWKGSVPLPSKKLRLRLDFDPARFGARAGDRIGVQVLHCPRGWSYAGPLETLVEIPWMIDTGAPVRMTNRVEFVAR